MFNLIGKLYRESARNFTAFIARWSIWGRVDEGHRPIFVVGCQRSGTTIFIRVLSKCSDIQVYGEDNKAAFGEGVRIRSDKIISSLISESSQPIVVFKPINDSQNTDSLLQAHTDSKAIWIYRHYYDVVNSLVQKWGGTQIDSISQIVTGKYAGPGIEALGERISSENLSLARKLDAMRLSANDAAAFIWYIRNSIYFDLNLADSPRVLLCKYEDIVTDPEKYFCRTFEFIGGKYSASYVTDVLSTSVKKSRKPYLTNEVAQLCESLMARMDKRYRIQNIEMDD